MRAHKHQRTPFTSYNYSQQPPQSHSKGNEDSYEQSSYCLAKHFEYNPVERDLDKALHYYHQALKEGYKKDSTIKDLAGVLHQKGKTQEAVEFLRKHRGHYQGDLLKYDNLTENLARQVMLPSGRNLNKFILVANLDRDTTADDIRILFGNSSRIQSVIFYKDLSFTQLAQPGELPSCLVEFPSYSAARKTVDTFLFEDFPQVELYWVNVNKLLICEACRGKEDLMKLNSHYFGFSAFGSALYILPDSELFDLGVMKEKNLQTIWKNALMSDGSGSARVAFENETKLKMIRSKRVG